MKCVSASRMNVDAAKKVGRSKRTEEICHCRENTSLRHPITIIFQSVQKDSAAALLHLNGCHFLAAREAARLATLSAAVAGKRHLMCLRCGAWLLWAPSILTKQGALARPASLRVWPLDGRCTWRPSNCYIRVYASERASGRTRSVRERWSINGTQM